MKAFFICYEQVEPTPARFAQFTRSSGWLKASPALSIPLKEIKLGT